MIPILKENSLVIFLFHGVIERNSYKIRNYRRKHIEKDYFYKFLKKALDLGGHPLSMDEVVSFYNCGKQYPPKSFVVTFDDGFENNYSVAAPILADLNIPAVIYLTTEWVDKNMMGWIDRIEYCLENVNNFNLKLPWRKENIYVDCDKCKFEILEEIRSYIKLDSTFNINGFISYFYEQCDDIEVVSSSNDPLDLKMNWLQADELARHPNFLIGGHTTQHQVMAYLSDKELYDDVNKCIEMIQTNTSVNQLRHFSYPEGLEFCYNQKVINCLKKSGIVCSPSAIDGTNDIAIIDLYNLRRVTVI